MALKQSNSIVSNSIYDKENDQYTTTYSKRGIECPIEDLSIYSIGHLYQTAWKQDDFGLVTIHTNNNGDYLRFVVERSNLGYSVRAWINHNPCYALDGFLSYTQTLAEKLKEVC